ncbi:TetR/AcrR family transcriptional regulator [Streptacidiphilus cavernicola]|uniref:TetR/AcrR family transcriptional regulator n=1 Tax=Streptacidiphilus cavernicola TaxID=3342716 RepID=A0ABV6VWB3_9ACTN
MPRPGLTRPRIIAEAAAVADETGLERLTLAAVAKRCGVSLPGLYKHIDSLDAVRRDLAVQAVQDLTAAMAMAAAGLAGRDALHAVAAAYRDFAAAHPGLAAAGVRAPAPGDAEHAAAGLGAVTVLASVLKGYGIEGDDATDAIRSLRAVLHGFTSLEAAGGFGLPQSVDGSFTRLVDGMDAAFRQWV